MVTLFAILALIVSGGFISYYGDLQGRRWGKKRVSWFGLRPKHTAIIITSITGAGIALLTVIVILSVAPTIREVVLRGEAAINEYQRFKKASEAARNALQVQLKATTSQNEVARAEVVELNKQAASARLESDKIKKASSDLANKNAALIAGNMDLQNQRAGLERSIQNNLKELAQQKKEIANATIINRDLGQQNVQMGRQNTILERDNTRLLASNSKLKDSNQKLKAANDSLVSDNRNLDMKYQAAKNAYLATLDDYEKLQNTNRGLEDKQNSLTASYSRLKGQYDDLAQQRDELSNYLVGTSRDFVRNYMALRQTRYNLRADTELARRTLDAHLTPAAVRAELMTLLKDASDRARQYGAAVGDNGRAVAILPKRLVTPASDQMADETASLNAIVDQIAGSNTPVVVVARAINNSLPKEQVIMDLFPFTSTIVFKAGEVVATRAVDARQPIEGVVGSVIRFLKDDVRNAAIKAGTIPQISPENGEEEVGMIDTPEMMTLIDRIRRFGGNVQLTAVANEPLTSADLLTFGQSRGGKPHNLRFDLKRAPGKQSRGESAAE